MKKFLLAAMLMASTTTFAQLPQEVTSQATPEDLTNFFTAVSPKAAENQEQLNVLFQTALQTSSSDAKVVANSTIDLEAIAAAIKEKFYAKLSELTGIEAATLEGYVHKVIPGYLRLVVGRKTPGTSDMSFTHDQLFRSPADGAWYGYGDERNYYNRFGSLSEDEQKAVVAAGGKVKHSGSYAWGMKTVGNKIYWGDNNNYLCTFGASMGKTFFGSGQTDGNIVNTSCMVCEYRNTSSLYSDYDMGDVYPPHIYVYDPTGEDNKGVVEDIAPDPNSDDAAEQEAWKNLENAQGLRSCGSHKGVIFFGGPGMCTRKADGTIDKISDSTITVSSAFLAYDADNGKWLGGSDMSNIEMPDGSDSGCRVTDIRRWVIYNDELYTGVGLTDKNGYKKGGVLRWIGDKEHPFRFVCVGLTDGECGEICFHKGRIYGGGWPINPANTGGDKIVKNKFIHSAIYRGPEIPEDGTSVLPAIDPNDNEQIWPNVWDYAQYEYETNSAQFNMVYTSNMISWNGKMYWAMFAPTYVVPGNCLRTFGISNFDDLKNPEELSYCINNIRGTTLWRIDEDGDFENGGVEMLYGEAYLPKLKDGTTVKESQYEMVPNVGGYKPVWGRDGYGNITTSYTWSFMPYRDKLMISTMDYSCMMKIFENETSATNKMAPFVNIVKKLLRVDDDKMGWECLVLKSNDEAPKYITEDGFGNHYAYGLRNFSVCKDANGIEQLLIGTANPLNIACDADDPLNPEVGGGWQIWRVIEDGQEAANGNNSTQAVTGINSVKADQQKVNIIMRKGYGYITFSTFDGKNIDEITVTDLSGKTVSSENPGKNIAYVVTDGMPTGAYIVKIKSNGDKFSAKIVK